MALSHDVHPPLNPPRSLWGSGAADNLSRDSWAADSYVSASWSRYKNEEKVELAFRFLVALNRLGGVCPVC